ncbi:hypothetical protein E2C01_076666 [Portunus trituberculatus]|uniref:Uncharacterized protein n=1 Tax=Portunus trituberculatus TaxID=210409 RepID=A0A5B7II76_PORTR|nr:hypothetical protein [Portunus trituberculatus]
MGVEGRREGGGGPRGGKEGGEGAWKEGEGRLQVVPPGFLRAVVRLSPEGLSSQGGESTDLLPHLHLFHLLLLLPLLKRRQTPFTTCPAVALNALWEQEREL